MSTKTILLPRHLVFLFMSPSFFPPSFLSFRSPPLDSGFERGTWDGGRRGSKTTTSSFSRQKKKDYFHTHASSAVPDAAMQMRFTIFPALPPPPPLPSPQVTRRILLHLARTYARNGLVCLVYIYCL